jgi:peptide/nickel transport system ATP-binding protein
MLAANVASARQPVIEVKNLKKHFPAPGQFLGQRRHVRALDGVDLVIERGETLSVVGESGSGKSTLGKIIMGLIRPTDGEVWFEGQRIDNARGKLLRTARRNMQMVFQDPYSSMNPRLLVRDIIAEPLINFRLVRTRAEIDARVMALLDQVRLPRDALWRYPHEFSGGQRQRIAIARALAPGARFIVCDEAVSALDVSVKAQIVNLLKELQLDLGLTLLFISHDMAIVEHLTDRVAVMYLGKIIEVAERRTLFSRPAHPYTRALLSAVPVPDPTKKRERIVLEGDVPSPIDPPPGCRFHTRCPFVQDRCRVEEPQLRSLPHVPQVVACHFDFLNTASGPVAAG